MIWFSFAILFARFFWTELQIFPPGFFENNFFHRGCVKWVEYRQLSDIYVGLFCGSTQVDEATKTLFKQTGLYHLLVVSGAHLVFLENIIDRILRGREKSKLMVFLVFSVVCQLNPPIARALIAQIFKFLSIKNHLFINDETRILLSGLWCLIFFPQWILSLSLLLSWMASLALNYQIATWKKHFLIALYLLPFMQSLSLASILNNLLFSVAFEWLLFPLSFACFALPGLTTLGNTLWNLAQTLMALLPTTDATLSSVQTTNFWPYVFLFHLFHRLKR